MNDPLLHITPDTDIHQLSRAEILPSADGQSLNVAFMGHLSSEQIQDLASGIRSKEGLFSRFRQLAYHISGDFDATLAHALLQNVPVNARVYDIFYTRPEDGATVRIWVQCSSGKKRKQRASASVPADCDIRQFEANLGVGILDTVVELEVRTPRSAKSFGFNEHDLMDSLRHFIIHRQRSLKKITLAMVSPLFVPAILKVIGLASSIKVLHLVDGQYCNTSMEETLPQVFGTVSRSHRLPDLYLPGAAFSWDLLLALGGLDIRSLCFDSEISSTFPSAEVTTPRANAFQLVPGPSALVVTRVHGFSHLQSLFLSTALSLFVDMYAVLSPVASLKQLSVISPMLDGPIGATQVFQRIAALFPSLTCFHLKVDNVHELEEHSWLHLHGLLAFRHLDDLSLVHPLPLGLDDALFARFLHAWPLMTRLNLNPTPSVPFWPVAYGDGGSDAPVPTLSWDALRGPARWNGVLKEVNVYLGAQQFACAPVRVERSLELDTNHVLESMVVGTYGAIDPHSLAILGGLFVKARIRNRFY